MNYLAHAYLSFEHPDVLVGNMISDFVKGKNQYGYPSTVQRGIRLHRAIDRYTDTHPLIAEAKTYFRESYGLYSGAIVDVLFDHFLATDNRIFGRQELGRFSQWVYRNLEERSDFFPDKFARMFPYMKAQDWLLNYSHKENMENSLGGLVRRARYLSESGRALAIFLTHYDALRESYEAFFPQLEQFAREELDRLYQQ